MEPRFKKINVTRGNLAKNGSQEPALVLVQLVQRSNVTFAQDERFERPNGPKGHQHDERVVLANDALVSLQFQLQIIA